MPPFKDLTGKTFGRLTAKSVAGKKRGSYTWHCECSCGNTSVVTGSHLTNGNTTSCGCHKASVLPIACTKHGQSKGGRPTKTYSTWAAMNNRCNNPKTGDYKWYGGVGVSVCERWRSFENFYEDMGDRPAGKTLDRYPDNTGNYEPSNCRWATPKEQANNLTTNRWITYNGRTLTLSGWSEALNMTCTALHKRLTRWPLERALTEPLHLRKAA